MNPKASVLIPSYNHRRFIQESISSVLSQTESDFELLILDDGSTDESMKIIESFASQDNRIRCFQQKNCGTIETLNRLYSRSRGKYICHLGSDDVWSPTFLSSSLLDLDRHPEHVATFCNFSLIDAHGSITCAKGAKIDGDLTDASLMAEIAVCNIIAALTACIRRSAIEKTLPFAQQRVGVEDWDLWLRLSLVGPMRLRDENLGKYRMHETNQSRSNLSATYASQLQILSDHAQNIIDLYHLSPQISANVLMRKFFLHEQLGDKKNSCECLEKKRKLCGLTFAEYACLASNYLSLGETKKADSIDYMLREVQRRSRALNLNGPAVEKRSNHC